MLRVFIRDVEFSFVHFCHTLQSGHCSFSGTGAGSPGRVVRTVDERGHGVLTPDNRVLGELRLWLVKQHPVDVFDLVWPEQVLVRMICMAARIVVRVD